MTKIIKESKMETLLTPKQVADMMGWNVGTIYNKISKEAMDIPFVKMKGKKGAIRFRQEVVEKYLERRTVKQTA